MKKNIIFLLTALAAFIFIGCSNPGLTPGEVPGTDSNATGTVRFSWSDGEAASRSRANNILDADKVVITIEAADGTVVYNQKQLKLYNFNGSFISEPLSLKVGNYKLTEYLILDSAGTVIFATPKAGSEQAHLVTMPLPHDFTVTKDGTTKVKPQVVDAAAVTPADFGYATFSFEEAKVFNFLATVMVFDATADNFILTDAALDVTTDVKIYSYALTNVTNNLAINDVAGNYTVTVKKAGYANHVATYTNAEMKGFFQSPLVVVLTEKQAPVNNIITFVDPALEAVVREAIVKPTGDIYKSDVATLTELYAGGSKHGYITNLSGIEHLTSLTTLRVNSRTMADFSALSKLTNLTKLIIESQNITDLSPLSTLTKLTTLIFYSTELSDISPLSTLTELRVLNFTDGFNKISDLTPLSKMTKLTEFSFENAVSDTTTDLTPLSNLSSLTKLTYTRSKVVDLTPLSGLTNLTYLNLRNNSVTDISPLSSLTNLTNISLYGNKIGDITTLSALIKLAYLNLENNQISDLSPLVNNTGLGNSDTLYLRLNPLSNDAQNVQIPALKARGVYVYF